MVSIVRRTRILALVLIAAGLSVAGVGFLYGIPTATDGLDSAQAIYREQGVELSYDDQGRLVDRGTVEGAQAIMSLLRDDFGYPVDIDNFDADDPLINTRDELMFQYATITYHVLHGERTVTLTEEDVPLTYRGVEYTEPGEYPIVVEAYYGELDRSHPIEGQLREAWNAQALALTAQLAAGHANQAVGELAFMTSLLVGCIGLAFAAGGGGLLWVTYGRPETATATGRGPAEPGSPGPFR